MTSQDIVNLKASVRARDGYRCQDCGKHQNEFSRALHVHRLEPGSEYTFDGTVSLCHPCHKKRHPRERHIATLVTIPVYMPDELKAVLRAEARKAGQTMSAFSVLACAEAAGRPDLIQPWLVRKPRADYKKRQPPTNTKHRRNGKVPA